MDDYSALISGLIKDGYLKTDRVINAFYKVPRTDFLSEAGRRYAFYDEPIPIGYDQTMSAPHMVAMMIELLDLRQGDKVLEIGTGSGWNAAIMSLLVSGAGRIYTVEIVPELYEISKKRLEKYSNVRVFLGDGSMGLSGHGKFDRIVVTCAAPEIPDTLKDQLKDGGIIVIPIGTVVMQELVVGRKKGRWIEKENHGMCRFVQMRGKSGF